VPSVIPLPDPPLADAEVRLRPSAVGDHPALTAAIMFSLLLQDRAS
jgi:hypothetical protein